MHPLKQCFLWRQWPCYQDWRKCCCRSCSTYLLFQTTGIAHETWLRWNFPCFANLFQRSYWYRNI